MKISGIDPKNLVDEDVLVLPRGQAQLVIRAKAVRDFAAFERFCKTPKPPKQMTKDGAVLDDLTDPAYLTDLESVGNLRFAYLVVNSLQDFEWDTVVNGDPSTWLNWEVDLKNNGVTDTECKRILALVAGVNCLDEQKLKRARDDFFRGQVTA